MSRVSVEMPDYNREDPVYLVSEEVFISTLVVRPPIVVGRLFEPTILGRKPFEVSLQHIVSTDEATVLEVGVGRTRDTHERAKVIKAIANRITLLSAFPQEAGLLCTTVPFADRTTTTSMREHDLLASLPANTNS